MFFFTKRLAVALVSFGIAFQALAATTVYVPVGSANKVLVVDGESDPVIGRIGDVTNAHGLAGSSVNDLLVAGNMSPAVADQTIPDGMSEDEHNAHHVNNSASSSPTGADASYISIIDTSEKRVMKRIDVDGISHHTAITPDGRYAISTHTTTGKVSVIDMQKKSLLKTIPTGPVPNYVLVSSDGKFAYVSNSGNGTLSEIAIDQWSLRRNFKTGTTPEHMVFSKDERMLYVINVGDNSIGAISIDKGEQVKSYSVGTTPHGIDISDDGERLFVSNKQGNDITLIDLKSGTSNTQSLHPAPYHVKSIRGTGKLYVSSRAQPWIWVIDQKDLSAIKKIPIEGEGHQMVLVQN